jgi:hypothetical protein
MERSRGRVYPSGCLAVFGDLCVVGIVMVFSRYVCCDMDLDTVYFGDDALLEEVGGNSQA